MLLPTALDQPRHGAETATTPLSRATPVVETAANGSSALLAPPSLPASEAMPASVVASSGKIALPVGVQRFRIVWPYLIVLVLFHLTLPLAFVPWLFSWTGLALIPIGNYIFCSTGIGLCYHRLLTHQGLQLPKWLEHFFALLGVCCLMESPARWVAIHRMHHKFSDEQSDPHSPLAGFLWGHFEWLIHPNPTTNTAELYDRFAKDILRDPFYMWLQRNGMWMIVYGLHALVFMAVSFAAGWWWSGNTWGGLQFASSVLLWGVIYRTIYTWHVTWAVNSVSHLWGYRNYGTGDSSRNNWLVAIATNGEGWHNNHHADQVSAAHGHRWWEIDITWLTIRALEAVGLATNVKRPKGKA